MKTIQTLSEILSQKASDSKVIANELLRENLYSSLKELGTTDFARREEHVLPTLKKFFVGNLCEPSLRIEALNMLLTDDFINKDINIGESESSILRSTSLLTMVGIITGMVVNKDHISKDNIKKIEDLALKSLYLEKDYRGYDEQLGWIHIYAHLADLFGILAYTYSSVESKKLLQNVFIWLSTENSKNFGAGEDLRFGKSLSLHMQNCDEDMKDLFNEDLYPDIIPYNQYMLYSSLTACHLYLSKHKEQNITKLELIQNFVS